MLPLILGTMVAEEFVLVIADFSQHMQYHPCSVAHMAACLVQAAAGDKEDIDDGMLDDNDD